MQLGAQPINPSKYPSNLIHKHIYHINFLTEVTGVPLATDKKPQTPRTIKMTHSVTFYAFQIAND